MGRGDRRQESHAKLRFLKMLRAGMYILFSYTSVDMWAHGMVVVYDRALSQAFISTKPT